MAVASSGRRLTASAWLVRVTAAACLFGAEAIHVAVMDSQFDEWLLAGLFFLAISLIEGVLAVALLATPSRVVSWLAIGVSLDTVALWLGSRTIGISAGPAPGVEAFGLADSIASLLELLTVAALLIPSTEPASIQRSATDILQAAMVISTVAALTLVGVTQGASDHVGHAHHAAGALGRPAPRPTDGPGEWSAGR